MKYLDLLESVNIQPTIKKSTGGRGYYLKKDGVIMSERFETQNEAILLCGDSKGFSIVHESDYIIDEGVVETLVLSEQVIDNAVQMTSYLNQDRVGGSGPNKSKEYMKFLQTKHGDAHAMAVYKTAQKLASKETRKVS